jgi:hypothetical protein
VGATAAADADARQAGPCRHRPAAQDADELGDDGDGEAGDRTGAPGGEAGELGDGDGEAGDRTGAPGGEAAEQRERAGREAARGGALPGARRPAPARR